MPARPVTRGSKSGVKPPRPKGKPTAKTRATTSSAGPTKKVPRSRTFTGCRTCRSRHLKCDETRPVCSSCRRLNLVCEGYDGQLLWVPDPLCSAEQKHAHRGTSYRYPLFTEKERKTMSVEIVTSMGHQSAGDIVLDLDEKSVHADDAHVAGPFGVFRAFDGSTDTGSSPLQHSVSESSPNTSPSDALPEIIVGELDEDIEEVVIEPWSVDDNSLAMEPYFLPGPFDNFSTDGMIDNMSQPWMHGEGTGSFPLPDEQDLSISRKAPSPFTNNMPGIEPYLPSHAASLLRYYKTMESSSSVKGMRISPWQLWLLPCALETFAELSLWNTTSHTRHSILCTLLAKSAFHMHQSSNKGSQKPTTQWQDIGQNYQKSAQSHLKMALQGESDQASQAKYNEILMAILATAMVSVLYNGSRAVKIFLLDAERLIRLRGLAMPKSFNIRVLHHVYTHLRVIAESTDIAIDSAKSQAQAATEMAVSLRKFRIAEDSLGADLDLSREKPAEVGYADIHLDVSGHWPVTMYPEIYGVPESLMTLLSQTISFANEKTKLEAMAMYDHRISMALSRHIKQLEQNIWSWSLGSSDMQSGPSRPRELVTQETKLVDHPLIRSLTLAMHQALIIYFYRRVYNMSAMVIQDSVRKTLDFIQPCLEETADDHDFATSIGWAAFIAACEATTPDLQERGLKVLQTIDNSGVIFGTDKPSVLAQSVWDKRTETGDWTLSWPDIMKTIPR
ncbi:fungal-specific transcription factor domain-containing protein [Colletotrichum phormii]|uniref:Fungal-specific transcription factor domain-containing protein n=1 Tax=Colletotrichum phormii TaxID=359342 RepID=A0AAJ0ECM5_9PEZI|nr:fungal-specific transcription factor domain-containing protein [Colletotrichum phormii]KAK1633773.1 fungal-specific transcription factor domain-containing protein [Colletotrichum phormii]